MTRFLKHEFGAGVYIMHTLQVNFVKMIGDEITKLTWMLLCQQTLCVVIILLAFECQSQ